MARRNALIALAGVASVAIALVVSGSLRFGGAQAAPAHAVPTALARIVRTNVIERQQAAGTLAFSGSFTVYNGPTPGVVTWLPSPGSVIRRGGRLYELDARPVTLFYGARPAYRTFARGMSGGADVRALKQNLLALGFTDGGGLTVDDRFDGVTEVAVKQLQRSLGLPETGAIPLGTVVFLPQPVRIAATAVGVGAAAAPSAPILSATATERTVLVPLDPGVVSQLAAGDRVVVTMPDNSTTAGRVTSVGRVATAGAPGGQDTSQAPAPPTIPVTVRLLHPRAAGGLDQAPVQVAITTAEDRHVLSAPISALLARPDGGYALDVRTGASTQLVPVTTGLFDDLAGRVEISGRGLAQGIQVEVPAG